VEQSRPESVEQTTIALTGTRGVKRQSYWSRYTGWALQGGCSLALVRPWIDPDADFGKGAVQPRGCGSKVCPWRKTEEDHETIDVGVHHG
jgi:hypothetical protein